MSNYSQTTQFGPKDALLSGNPAKLIVGAAYDVEFGNIATAIATKPDNLTTSSFLNTNVTGNAVPVNGIYLPATNTLGFASNTTQRGTVNASGNWAINAPGSGIALAIAGTAIAIARLSSDHVAGIGLNFNDTNAAPQSFDIGLGVGSGGATFVIYDRTNAAARLTLTSTGNFTFSAPTSGTGLTNNGSAVFGSPIGGDKGAGTLNATGLFVNGVAVVTTNGSANPSASIGLAAVNGTATTFMTSDSAPALSQAISPTWSGTHTFSGAGITTTFSGKVLIGAPTTGDALSSTGAAGNYAATFTAAATTPRGVQIIGGTTSADLPLIVKSAGGTNNLFIVAGNGTLTGFGTVAAAAVDLTPDATSYTGTLTGCTSAPTCTVTLRRVGNVVVCNIGAITAVSNATTATITGSLPASFQPAALDQLCPIVVEDNGAFVIGYAKITHLSSTITLLRGDGAAFQSVGTKGIAQATSFSYLLA